MSERDNLINLLFERQFWDGATVIEVVNTDHYAELKEAIGNTPYVVENRKIGGVIQFHFGLKPGPKLHARINEIQKKYVKGKGGEQ